MTRNAFAYVFAGAGTFRDSSEPRAVLTEHTAEPKPHRRMMRAITRPCSSIAATNLWCKPGPKAFGFYWFPASRSKSRSPGMARLS